MFDLPVPTIATLASTAVAAFACLGSAAWAYRRWRGHQQEAAGELREEMSEGDGPDRDEPLAFAGFLLSLLGLVTGLFVGLPALVVPA